MSITFFFPYVQHEEVVPYPDEPDHKERRPVAPFRELNMANGNALAVLEALGEPQDYAGVWTPKQAARILAKATLLLHTEAGVLSLVEPTVGSGNWLAIGRDAEYVKQRLSQMVLMCALAVEHDQQICWG